MIRRRVLLVLAACTAVVLSTLASPPAAVSAPADLYTGTHFGDGNLPPGCVRDKSRTNPDNVCHHMRVGLNALDSPQVDVLILVPASPTAERDMRIMRQSVEMWEAGIDYLAPQMGLDWLAQGMDFHISVDAIDITGGGQGGEFTTYPLYDPEIVVIASNPVGGIGIGIDPVGTVFANEDGVPCLPIKNPFDIREWEALPGFDSHHDARSGTYTEDCGGAGGNVCFAVNGAIDPLPKTFDIFNLFDLVSHEFGHCLTIGHVGDGAEGSWGAVPRNDIMAYSSDPPGRTKCVSTLDVESVALRMSRYLDVNGDGKVSSADRLTANNVPGDGRNSFQIQHPRDHLYASDTGSPLRCPQPDLGLVPGPRTKWTPQPASSSPSLTLTSPTADHVSADGRYRVEGTVGHGFATAPGPAPTNRSSLPLAFGPFSPLSVYELEREGGNHFEADDSSLGLRQTGHHHSLEVPAGSEVSLTLQFPAGVPNDLDLIVSSDEESVRAATTSVPEKVSLKASERVDIYVDPYSVGPAGLDYQLTASVWPVGAPPPPPPCSTCPPPPSAIEKAAEHVKVSVGGAVVAAKPVDTSAGSGSFAFDVQATGRQTITVSWYRGTRLLGIRSVQVGAA